MRGKGYHTCLSGCPMPHAPFSRRVGVRHESRLSLPAETSAIMNENDLFSHLKSAR